MPSSTLLFPIFPLLTPPYVSFFPCHSLYHPFCPPSFPFFHAFTIPLHNQRLHTLYTLISSLPLTSPLFLSITLSPLSSSCLLRLPCIPFSFRFILFTLEPHKLKTCDIYEEREKSFINNYIYSEQGKAATVSLLLFLLQLFPKLTCQTDSHEWIIIHSHYYVNNSRWYHNKTIE